MEQTDLDQAAEAAVLLGAEQVCREHPGGYVSPVPDWLHEAVDAALPEHLGFGEVEGVLLQRGPARTGGYRFAREEDRRRSAASTVRRGEFTSLTALLPQLALARVRRLLREAA